VDLIYLQQDKHTRNALAEKVMKLRVPQSTGEILEMLRSYCIPKKESVPQHNLLNTSNILWII